MSLARERLIFGQVKAEAAECLLEFLARTVGGPFAPFAESWCILEQIKAACLAFICFICGYLYKLE